LYIANLLPLIIAPGCGIVPVHAYHNHFFLEHPATTPGHEIQRVRAASGKVLEHLRQNCCQQTVDGSGSRAKHADRRLPFNARAPQQISPPAKAVLCKKPTKIAKNRLRRR